jgi:hypothetical protein
MVSGDLIRRQKVPDWRCQGNLPTYRSFQFAPALSVWQAEAGKSFAAASTDESN